MTNRDRTPGRPGTPSEPAGTPGETADDGSSRHPFRPVLALMVLIVLALLATGGFKSYRDLDSAQSHEQKLLDQITAAEERVRILNHRIERIRNDPAMLERLAREDLGLVRDDDVVIVLPDPRPARRSGSEPALGTTTAASQSETTPADASNP